METENKQLLKKSVNFAAMTMVAKHSISYNQFGPLFREIVI